MLQGTINLGTRGPRTFVRGHIVLGRPVTPPLVFVHKSIISESTGGCLKASRRHSRKKVNLFVVSSEAHQGRSRGKEVVESGKFGEKLSLYIRNYPSMSW